MSGRALLSERHPEVRALFYCVGAQKAGTSWLADALSRHPDCHVPRRKELHYWTLAAGPVAPDERARRLRYLRWARRRLAAALLRPSPARLRSAAWVVRRARDEVATLGDPSVERYLDRLMAGHRGQPVVGEATPDYAVLGRDAFAAMAALHPGARFVFVMRDPVERLWSSVRHRFRTDVGGDDALEARIQQAFAAALDPRRRIFRMSDYRATIEALDAAVGSERVHYLFYETMRSRPEMDRLGAFLGLGPVAFEAERRRNAGTRAGLVPDAATLRRARAALDPVYRYVADRFAGASPAGWRWEGA